MLDQKIPSKLINFSGKKYLFLGIIPLVALGLIEIWVNNTVASSGQKYEDIFNLQQKLVLENIVLENEIAKEASLINIATVSAQLGFSKAKTAVYIK